MNLTKEVLDKMHEPVLPIKIKVWHVGDFCKAHFPECQSDPRAVEYNYRFGCFRNRKFDQDHALLPKGWTATEILLHESKMRDSCYENKWGFAVYIGPDDLIRALIKLEEKRTSSQQAVLNFLSDIDQQIDGIQAEKKSGRFAPNVV